MGEILTVLAYVTDFLGLVLSIWLGFFLLARGHGNRLVYRAVIILFAIGLYYFVAYSSYWVVIPNGANLRGGSIVVALIAIHNLTYQLLSPELKVRSNWLARAVLGFGVVSLGILIGSPANPSASTEFITTLPPGPWTIAAVFDIGASAAIAYNLWCVRRDRVYFLNKWFYAAVAIGVATILYGTVETLFRLDLPRFVATLLLLTGLTLMGYSAGRFQDLVVRRTSYVDFLLSAIVNLALMGIFVLLVRRFGLSVYETSLVAVLAVASHAFYDLFQEYLHQRSERQDRALRSKIRMMARSQGKGANLDSILRRALGILCHNLEAQSGLVALREGAEYYLAASFHSLPAGERFSAGAFSLDATQKAAVDELEGMDWLVPVFAAGEQVGVLGLGPRLGLKEYTEDDFDWMEEVAENMGVLYQVEQDRLEKDRPASPGEVETSLESSAPEVSELFSTLALKPDRKVIKMVEDGLRNFQDYASLGRSPLAQLFNVKGPTHIERGKDVQRRLFDTLELLRPGEKRPPEPIPREWHHYVVLHDAYVSNVSTREIMARLYISEGTYYRTRRKALRGVARAILERGEVAA